MLKFIVKYAKWKNVIVWLLLTSCYVHRGQCAEENKVQSDDRIDASSSEQGIPGSIPGTSDSVEPPPAQGSEGKGAEKTTDTPANNTKPTPEEMYDRLFKQKRISHMEAIKTMVDFKQYEKQYKLVNILMEKIIKVVNDAKVHLMQSGFTPGDAFPEDEAVRESYAHVLENTHFFGDILLHFPKITHQLLKKNREWQVAMYWSIGFCNETNLYQQQEAKFLSLVSQELGLIEKDPNYVNPYSNELAEMEEELAKELFQKEQERVKKEKKKKKPIKRGPRMSGGHTEL